MFNSAQHIDDMKAEGRETPIGSASVVRCAKAAGSGNAFSLYFYLRLR